MSRTYRGWLRLVDLSTERGFRTGPLGRIRVSEAMTTRRLLRLVGELIRTTRISRGITQRVLGERAGIVGKYVSEIERGTRDVPLSTLLAIVEHGLGRRLAIRFENADEASQGVLLPAGVEQVAIAISALPDATRAKVLHVVQAILELTR